MKQRPGLALLYLTLVVSIQIVADQKRTVDPWSQFYKTFFGGNRQIFHLCREKPRTGFRVHFCVKNVFFRFCAGPGIRTLY